MSKLIPPSLTNGLGHILQGFRAMCVAHLFVEDVKDAIVLAVAFRAANGAELRGEHMEWTPEVQTILHGEAVLMV